MVAIIVIVNLDGVKTIPMNGILLVFYKFVSSKHLATLIRITGESIYRERICSIICYDELPGQSKGAWSLFYNLASYIYAFVQTC